MDIETNVVEIFREAKTVAVVSLSPKPYRDNHSATRYRVQEGHEAIDIETRLFRMRLGITTDMAAELAREAGVPVIMDDSLGVEHQALKLQGKL